MNNDDLLMERVKLALIEPEPPAPLPDNEQWLALAEKVLDGRNVAVLKRDRGD